MCVHSLRLLLICQCCRGWKHWAEASLNVVPSVTQDAIWCMERLLGAFVCMVTGRDQCQWGSSHVQQHEPFSAKAQTRSKHVTHLLAL